MKQFIILIVICAIASFLSCDKSTQPDLAGNIVEKEALALEDRSSVWGVIGGTTLLEGRQNHAAELHVTVCYDEIVVDEIVQSNWHGRWLIPSFEYVDNSPIIITIDPLNTQYLPVKDTINENIRINREGNIVYFGSWTHPGGDISDDNMITAIDFSILVSQYNDTIPAGTGADINASGVVDTIDFLILQNNFNTRFQEHICN